HAGAPARPVTPAPRTASVTVALPRSPVAMITKGFSVLSAPNSVLTGCPVCSGSRPPWGPGRPGGWVTAGTNGAGSERPGMAAGGSRPRRDGPACGGSTSDYIRNPDTPQTHLTLREGGSVGAGAGVRAR